MIDNYYDALDHVHAVDDCIVVWHKYKEHIKTLSAQDRADAWNAAVSLVAEISGLDTDRAREWFREATRG